MATETELQVESFLKAVARAPQSLLMLDYDGTLAPFHKNRMEALPYPGIVPLLRELMSTGKMRVVIVSGREGTEIIPLLGIQPHPEIWGLHGLQRLRTDGSEELSRLDETTIENLSAAKGWAISQNLRQFLELKFGSIVVHWRDLDESLAQSIRQRVMPAWTEIAKRGLDLMEFDGGLEIRAQKTNKGEAARTILSELNKNVPAAYLGDDVTDETAFPVLEGRGLSVLVRPAWRPTAAKAWLRPPDDVLNFLTCCLEVCRQRTRTPVSA
ncbi:MAG TPA: trehalose-phosphatase [Candidatus Aquilonibacter sp.]|jgi:trehalose 6-phosphate phosphatase|nr:trehalose-phosphatase [Candidatus Aquilonibacter sp.]